MKRQLLPLIVVFGFIQAGSGQDCSVPFVPGDLKPRLDWYSNLQTVSTFSSPIVANMNPQEDDIQEIIICNTPGIGPSNPYKADKIEFYRGNGSNFDAPKILTIPQFISTLFVGPVIGDINKDGIPELLIVCEDMRIRVYHQYTENGPEAMKLWVTSSASELLKERDVRIALADFDGDGSPEIYAGSDIYRFNFTNPANPVIQKVLNGMKYTGNGYGDLVSGNKVCSPIAVDILSVADCNGDPDCEGLELVAGPVIYSIDTDNKDGDDPQIKIQRNLNDLQSGHRYMDGYTAVADLDLDGVLDIAVSSGRDTTQRGLYAWNKNGLLQFFPFILSGFNTNGGLPCIANVYEDGGPGPDLPEIIVCSREYLNCFNLNAAKKTPATPYWWTLKQHSLTSWESATAFDLNGDGLTEIIYRDNLYLRIMYGGPAPFPPGVDAQRNWYTFICRSASGDEHPIVADVDNDNEAEIVVVGSHIFAWDIGHLHVFESGGAPWMPCRNVWNQFNYMSINVNDDVSIPAQQLPNHHLEFPGPGSGKRPFNNFLVQQPILDDNFNVALPLPDAGASIGNAVCGANTFSFKLTVCNNGKKELAPGLPITMYATDPTTTNAAVLGAVLNIPQALKPGACTTLTITQPINLNKFYIVLNDNGSRNRPYQLPADFPFTGIVECNYANNKLEFDLSKTSEPPMLGPDLKFCTDTLVTLNAGNTYAAYRWQDGSTLSTLPTTKAGLYWVEVTDFCSNKHRDSIVFGRLELPEIQIDTTNGDCFGTPAAVSANVTGAITANGYLWSNAATTSMLSGIPEGNYTVTITGSNGCTASASAYVDDGGFLDVSIQQLPISCFGEKGEIQVVVNNGKAPFSYRWSDGSTNQNLAQATAGVHTVTITDGDQCIKVLQTALPQPEPLMSKGIQVQATCPNTGNGSALFLGAAQGTAPYTLLWSNDSTALEISKLNAGSYQLTITDAKGCTLMETVNIPEFTAPELQATVRDVNCFGEQSGSIAVIPVGGSPGFSYIWSVPSVEPEIKNLGPGNYSLTLSYADGKCTQVHDYQINEPLQMLLTATVQPAGCNGGAGGSIDLQVQQGIAPFSYLWSNGETTQDLNNAKAGDYLVLVTDSTGCLEIVERTVTEWPAISLTNTQTPLRCAGGADAAVQVNALGGSGTFQYKWSNGSDGPVLNGLSSGTYTVTVTDEKSCTAVWTALVNEPPALQNKGIITTASCPNASSGTAEFLGAAQGTPPYTLLWSNDSTTAQLNNLSAGDYQLTITDANHCTLTASALIPEHEVPSLQVKQEQVSCFGADNGSLSITASGGSTAYTYSWSNLSTQSFIDHLAPGTYSLTLSYADGKCSYSTDYQIKEPLEIQIGANTQAAGCKGAAGGSIDLTIQNGIAPIAYLWSNGETTQDLVNISSGDYKVTVSDANGCTQTYQQNLTETPDFSLDHLAIAPRCAGGADGSIQISAKGGTGAFQYQWSNGSSNATLTGLVAGSYTVTVKDAANCTQLLTLNLAAAPALQSKGINALASCPDKANGELFFLGATQGTAPYSLRWSNDSTGVHLKNLSAGIYQLTITDAKDCTLSLTTQVGQWEAPDVAATARNVTCFGEKNGSIAVVVTNGSPGYAYAWSNQAKQPEINGLSAGLYSLTLTYSDGKCTQVFDYEINEPLPILAKDSLVRAVNCFGGSDGAIKLSIEGGTQPYDILWSNGRKTIENSQIMAGQYSLSLTDAKGCSFQAQFKVPEPAAFALKPVIQADSCAKQNGAIVLAASGGTKPHAFVWSNASVDTSLTALSAGTYVVTLTDARNCSTNLALTVPAYGTVPTLSLQADTISCARPAVTLSAKVNQPVTTFNWDSPLGPLSNAPAQLITAGGLYRLTVSNSFGCQAEAQLFVHEDTQGPTAEAGPPLLKLSCSETAATLYGTGSSQGAIFKHKWLRPSAADTNALNISIRTAGLYRLEVTNIRNGCIARDSVVVDWDKPIKANILIDSIQCHGDADGLLQVQYQSGGTAPFEYAMDNQAFTPNPVFGQLSPGTYTLQLRDALGCRWESKVTLSEPPPIFVTLIASDTLIELGQTLRLVAQPLPKGVVWSDIVWEPSNLFADPDALLQQLQPEDDTNFKVRIVDKNGCEATDEVLVKVLNYKVFMPNAFLPGSAQNGYFTVFSGKDVSQVRLLRVFDRWGELVFERRAFSPNDPGLGWDGSYKGKTLDAGVFGWYTELELSDGNTLFLKGDVTILR